METKLHNESAYREAMNHLNAEQRAAVEDLSGPVLVVAGPGTGKTQMLATRAAHILAATDMDPSNLLALTFTNAGEVAMKNRLLELIGPEGQKVNVSTFHKFGNQFIQDHPDLFGEERSWRPIRELERRRLLRQLLMELPPDHSFLSKGAFPFTQFAITYLSNLFSTLKREGYDPQPILAAIDWEMEQLGKLRSSGDAADVPFGEYPVFEEYLYKQKSKAGSPKLNDIERQENRLTKLRDGLKLYERYQARLSEQGLYEYADMINWVNNALKNDDDLLADYRERFQHILVDEYQDTNGAQNQLLMNLLDEESPLVFCVGDDDQAIYRFQGAQTENILQFYKRFSEPPSQRKPNVIVLKKNYRSTQPILDAAEQVIAPGTERLINQPELLEDGIELDKTLEAAGPVTEELPNPPAPALRQYASLGDEQAAVFEQVRALLEKGVTPNEIAIIYRKNAHGRPLFRLFKNENLPAQLSEKVNILDAPIIQDLLLLMRYMHAERERPYGGEAYLANLLYAPFWGLDPYVVMRLLSELRQRHALRQGEGPEAGRRPRLIEMLREDFPEDEIDAATQERLKKIANRLGGWRKRCPPEEPNKTPDKAPDKTPKKALISWVEDIVNESGLLDYAYQQQDSLYQLRLIGAFYHFIETAAADEIEGLARFEPEASANAEKGLTLANLLALIHDAESEGEAIELTVSHGEDNGVQLLTGHKAKGREFDHVFILHADKKNWHSGGGGTKITWPLGLEEAGSPNLPQKMSKDEERSKNEEDSRRLFYVALTRARKHVHISWPTQDETGKETEQFFALSPLLSNGQAEQTNGQMATFERVASGEGLDGERADYLRAQLTPAHEPALANKDYLKQILEPLVRDYRLSATSLSAYLNDPEKFLYEHLLRLPSAGSPYLSLGIAVHKALELLFKQASPERGFPPVEQFVRFFTESFDRQKGTFRPDDFEQTRKQWTENILPALYRFHTQQAPPERQWTPDSDVEVDLSDVTLRGVPVKGKIDKVERHPDGLVLIDYKTGKPAGDGPKDERRFQGIITDAAKEEDNQPYGGDHWRQLLFYALMVENSERYAGLPVKQAVIEFVQHDENGDFIRKAADIQDGDREALLDIIEDVYRGIQALDFSAPTEEEELAEPHG